MEQHGTVVVFSPCVDKKEIEKFLDEMMMKQDSKGRFIIDRVPHIESFDPRMGSPVFYIP